MPWPCCGPCSSVRRISRSSVPCRCALYSRSDSLSYRHSTQACLHLGRMSTCGGTAVSAAQRPDEDFAREVDAHVQLEADRLVEEGLSPEAAAREARQRFGNAALARERFYYSSRSLWFDQLKQDVRTALRGIKRYPIACAIAVISLAGGIGATTITLLLRNAIFLAPPPLYQDPEALSYVRSPTPTISGAWCRRACSRHGSMIRRSAGALGASAQPRQQDLRAGDRVDVAAGPRRHRRSVHRARRATDARDAVRGMAGRRRSAGPAERRHLVPPVQPARRCRRHIDPDRRQAAHRDRRDAAPILVRVDGWTGLDAHGCRPPIAADVAARRRRAAAGRAVAGGADRAPARRAPSVTRRSCRRISGRCGSSTLPMRGTPMGNGVGPFVDHPADERRVADPAHRLHECRGADDGAVDVARARNRHPRLAGRRARPHRPIATHRIDLDRRRRRLVGRRARRLRCAGSPSATSRPPALYDLSIDWAIIAAVGPGDASPPGC